MAVLLGRISSLGVLGRSWTCAPGLTSCVNMPHMMEQRSKLAPSLGTKQLTSTTTSIFKAATVNAQNPSQQSRGIFQHNTDFDKDAQTVILSPRWIVETSPAPVKPYLRLMRFDRPIGTWLVYLPCTWSIAMAASPGHLPDPKLLATFALGSFLMRGAGCTINDMWDRRYDALVDRTRDRPLACGQLTLFQALVFLGGQLSCALGVLLTLNWYSVMVGACCMVPVIIYPIMKRYIHWPHVFLGVTLNWGVLVSWSAVQGHLDWPVVVPLYLSGVLFTTIYDIIYAYQDKEDDITAGVKSAALKLGERSKPWLTGFASTTVACLAFSGYMGEQTLPYFLGVGCVAAHLAHQIYTVDLHDRDDCGRKFRSNKALGFLLFAAIVAGTYMRPSKSEYKEDFKNKNETQM